MLMINVVDEKFEKKDLKKDLPDKLENIIKCKNPRCITSVETYVSHIFYAIDKEKGEYKCRYCDEIYRVMEE
ncbi:aspartate carbamoyltransferase regulatory subunit [Clostridium tetanomorphum]|uniref:Aspartate carbamoyltransferase regulatory subunit C-terminal domain-containing protein n=1 Tax=Clostridium tetanomorphum TaxID=1553 RepID=A0A923ED57_CLOTT|nr:hypothetical protein [Clostridium tetanomorphum]KAJ48969.1 aspartate carbamoyltransferase regulatory subunit [Clostridium tetanomorphum DSM 665]KAJ51328.1 aspartate carbamoyltransferase regulatory subunit [Clostridium tetanomorphum DSM 665]MBC2399829.1 hypothetical protein [Clostridium tetanomorphum]MBP1865993.1 aspartate carbamoyltransferase regulatory subunit [Clostridium tetanomorphum]NRS85953.1 aspartate carbamoyltransferase regulatory subunit [Clostridium tetanomorphum]